jgi:tetratricopeptide (TPR) repeat protein
MNTRHYIWSVLSVLTVCLLATAARADESDDEKMFGKVMQRLLKNDTFVAEYPAQFAYPPKAFIKPKSIREVNAYASAHKLHGAEPDDKTGKIRPVVMVTQGLLKEVIKGDEISLAIIMGHELAHLTKKHVADRPKGETELLMLSFGRDQEIEADLNGMRYAISSGYPYKIGVAKAFKEMRLNTKYSSFEGLNASHPSWEERLIFLDREQAKLWTCMSAFRNGYFFLELEQYLAAAQCFKAVTTEFPDCQEAWANLGYAKLMHYCDGLDSDDLKRYGIGQLAGGGFYTRPESLESKVRGIDEKLWKDAVAALNKALKIDPRLVWPRASLGIAYLVHPDGKQVKKSREFFQQAHDNLKNDPDLSLNPLNGVSLWINSGVADLAAGMTQDAGVKFQVAERFLGTGRMNPLQRSNEEALDYNQAIVLANSPDADQKRRALRMFEGYLRIASADSAWWPLARQRYMALAKELNVKAESPIALVNRAGPKSLRILTSVAVGTQTITLSEPITDAVDRLGKDKGDSMPLYPDAKMVRWHFADHGIDLLAKDKVLAIFLTSAKAPPLLLRQTGVGGEPAALKVGMSEEFAKQLLKDQRTDRNVRFIADASVGYRSYPELGLAVRYDAGRVAELAIAQIPRFSFAPPKAPTKEKAE